LNHALLIAARHASQSSGRLALCGLSGKVRDLFDPGGFLGNSVK
jgi:anti-anti-sigma regulatory factor